MDEAAGATTMVDSITTGVLNNGQIFSVQTGVTALAGGRAYQFDGTADYVKVPDSDELDPGTKKIVLSAVVRIPDVAMKDDSYDLVRKGLSGTSGGDWKMEIKRRDGAASVGRLNCVFNSVLNGDKVVGAKLATPDVVDGRIHTLQCIRDGSSVRAVVDGVVYEKIRASGSIVNSSPVYLGCKEPGDDVLQGTLDQVTVSIG